MAFHPRITAARHAVAIMINEDAATKLTCATGLLRSSVWRSEYLKRCKFGRIGADPQFWLWVTVRAGKALIARLGGLPSAMNSRA